MPRYIHGFHRRNVIAIRDPSNRARFAVNHNVSILLLNLRRELRFRKIADLKRWLISDEVRPYWREFKRAFLSRHISTANIIALRSATPTAIVTRRRRDISRRFSASMVMRILADQTKMELLRRTTSDKRQWTLSCHVAWFVAGVYWKCYRNRSNESMLPVVREMVAGRVIYSRLEMFLDIMVILMTLVRVDERQPGWGEDEEEEEF